MESKKTLSPWPVLDFNELKDTLETLHQWMQIVGKIRLRTMPWQNHSWHVALYISSHGFSTHGIPYMGRVFQIEFNFQKHKVFIECTGEETLSVDLRPMTVADFYDELFKKLLSIGIDVKIHGAPNEMDPAIPFQENTINKEYDPKSAHALWQAMLKTNNVFSRFRGEFIGKSSPVHLFWGGFDMAVTRFSGRSAPLHPGGIPNMPLEVMQEAYSQEVFSAGFWPGSSDFPPAFYTYIYPAAPEFSQKKVLPDEAFYSPEMGEFFLKYDDVQKSADPEGVLSAFLQSSYEAAAETLNWNRKNLERNHE